MDIDSFLSRISNPDDFEAMIDELAGLAPAPDFNAATSFFNSGGTESPIAQQFQTGNIPGGDFESQAGAQTPTVHGGTEDPLGPVSGGGPDIQKLLDQFAGAQPADKFQPNFAPLPGTPSGGGQVNVVSNSAGLGGGAQKSPLDSLAALIMKGAA